MDVLEQPRSEQIELPLLDGVELDTAFVRFLKARFRPDNIPNLGDVGGALILTEEACAAHALTQKNFHSIVRDIRLVAAGDHWDDTANRLINCGAISCEGARADVLVFRHFWQVFLDGHWAAVGRGGNLLTPQSVIEKEMWRRLCIARLKESVLVEEGEAGARFVGVRVFSPCALPDLRREEGSEIDDTSNSEKKRGRPSTTESHLRKAAACIIAETPKNGLPESQGDLVSKVIERAAAFGTQVEASWTREFLQKHCGPLLDACHAHYGDAPLGQPKKTTRCEPKKTTRRAPKNKLGPDS